MSTKKPKIYVKVSTFLFGRLFVSVIARFDKLKYQRGDKRIRKREELHGIYMRHEKKPEI